MSVKSTEGTGTLWNHVSPTQVPQCIGGTYGTSNDGTQPSSAWQFVCSKVVGDELVGGSGDSEEMAINDSDKEYMQKVVPLKQGQEDQSKRSMLRRISRTAKSGGTMLKSGVSKAKSGVSSAASKSSKGINADAETDIAHGQVWRDDVEERSE